jgi:hypothetical protein
LAREIKSAEGKSDETIYDRPISLRKLVSLTFSSTYTALE